MCRVNWLCWWHCNFPCFFIRCGVVLLSISSSQPAAHSHLSWRWSHMHSWVASCLRPHPRACGNSLVRWPLCCRWRFCCCSTAVSSISCFVISSFSCDDKIPNCPPLFIAFLLHGALINQQLLQLAAGLQFNKRWKTFYSSLNKVLMYLIHPNVSRPFILLHLILPPSNYHHRLRLLSRAMESAGWLQCHWFDRVAPPRHGHY